MSPTRDPLGHLQDALRDLDARGLLRNPKRPPPREAVSFCSNDYLGLARERRLPSDHPEHADHGAGASRLVDGERVEHAALETAFAEHLGAEAALAFTSGYAANVGVLSALAADGDLLISDALNHASLIDGARLSRAEVVVTPHLDLDAIQRTLERRTAPRAWVVVESYYSMDADGPDLERLRAICDRHHAALLVDEAHAIGVLGPDGRGRCAEAGVRPDVLIATLGKAFGAQGAIVAGRRVLREWLWNRARSFVFSTGLSPESARVAAHALAHSRAHPDLREKVLALATHARARLATVDGVRVLGEGHVVPLVVGDAARATALSTALATDGIDLPAIRPPTVLSARLRLTINARQTAADLDRLVDALRAHMRNLSVA